MTLLQMTMMPITMMMAAMPWHLMK